MKIVIGLGNPGADYSGTRHNVGHAVVDSLSQILKSKPEIRNKSQILIFKSPNFMNQSGEFVSGQLKKYKIDPEDLYIIHDDLDIVLGEFKIQFGRGPKDHNGLRSVDEALGTDQYWHVRIGVDNRPLDARPMGEEYVLQNFTDEEKVKILGVIKSVCKKLETLLKSTN